MAPTDTFKDLVVLDQIAETDDDHAFAVEYVQCRSEQGRSRQLIAGVSALVAGGVVALLHEREPEVGILAAVISAFAGLQWYYGYCSERNARHELSTVHDMRIRMILDKIRASVPSLAITADQVKASLLAQKK